MLVHAITTITPNKAMNISAYVLAEPHQGRVIDELALEILVRRCWLRDCFRGISHLP